MSLHFNKTQILVASAGAVVAISAVAYLANLQSLLLLGSFGASALLLFALPEVPLSQPRNVVGGHMLASAIAAGCLALFGPQWWAVGLATGLAVGGMMATRTLHPPAGSNAIIVFLAKPSLGLLLGSTFAGVLLLLGIASVYHRTSRKLGIKP